MREHRIKTYDKGLSDAYVHVLEDILDNHEIVCAPRGMKVYEIQNYTFDIVAPALEYIVTKDPLRSSVIKEYTDKEMALYLSGTTDVKDWIEASKFWGKIANPNDTINSNYGFLTLYDRSEGNSRFHSEISTPYEWAFNRLIEDKDTRQAIVRYNKPIHGFEGNKDYPCTMYCSFCIRDDKLNMSVRMRSSDANTGLVYDLYWFTYLMHMMYEDVKKKYTDLELGTLNFMADSAHIYEKDIDKILAMIGRK